MQSCYTRAISRHLDTTTLWCCVTTSGLSAVTCGLLIQQAEALIESQGVYMCMYIREGSLTDANSSEYVDPNYEL